MPRILAIALAALTAGALACRGEREAASSPAAADSAAVLVPLHGVELRYTPSDTSRVVFPVAAGQPLRLRESRDGWLRLATWDDREGWGPEYLMMEPPLWTHYQRALGGAPLSDLRPVYPLGDGRWGIEVPPPSPGIVNSASLWILAPETLSPNLAEVANVVSSCDGRYRMGIVADPPLEGRARGGAPLLERTRIATPAAPMDVVRAMEPREAPPDTAVVAAVARLADSLAAGDPGTRFTAVAGYALGDAVWITLAGGAGDDSRLAVVLVPGEGSAAKLVTPPVRAPAGATLRPVLALSTSGDGRPTVLVAVRANGDRRNVELYVARANDYQLFYRGYAWGC